MENRERRTEKREPRIENRILENKDCGGGLKSGTDELRNRIESLFVLKWERIETNQERG